MALTTVPTTLVNNTKPSNKKSIIRWRGISIAMAIYAVILTLFHALVFHQRNKRIVAALNKWTHHLSNHVLSNRPSAADNTAAVNQQRSIPTVPIETLTQSTLLDHTPNQQAILMIHYHKTGFVLSRSLRSHTIKHFSHDIQTHNASSTLQLSMPKLKPWGSIQQPRMFRENTKCPDYFRLEKGVINVQESPDFYCNVEEMARILLSEQYPRQQSMNDIPSEYFPRMGTKIIHFVRNPYSMVLSNYYYHAQDPTPEPWVKNHHPCTIKYRNRTETLGDLLVPNLEENILTKQNFDKILQTCESLYRTMPGLEKEGFEGHLQKLPPIDGLKLSAAQMMIRGGGVPLMPGGDVLRMANNIIQLKQLQTYASQSRKEDDYPPFTLVTVSMDDFLTHPFEFTMDYLKFVIGDNSPNLLGQQSRTTAAVKKEKAIMKSIALKFTSEYNMVKSKNQHKHITTGKHDDREALIESLRNDDLFGPILDRIEILVEHSLLESQNRIHD